MISISHWGMHEAPVYPMLLPAGFKLAPDQEVELRKPHGFVRIIPLEKHEVQPVYLMPSEGDCA